MACVFNDCLCHSLAVRSTKNLYLVIRVRLHFHVYLQSLHLEEVVPLEHCRLVSYDRLQDTIECSFEGRANEPIGEILSGLRGNGLLLEIRGEDAEFETYLPGGKFKL